MMNLHSLFTTRSNPEPLDLAEEVALVARAKEGDNAAFETLATHYAPRLRAASHKARFTIPDTDERTQTTLTAFFEAIRATEPGDPVAAKVKWAMQAHINKAVSDARGGLTVPHDTAIRYFTALKNANLPSGLVDLKVAAARASEHGLSEAAFWEVNAAVRDVDSLQGLASNNHADPGNYVKGGLLNPEPPALEDVVERKALADKARGAVEGVERQIVDLHYGFAEYDEVPDDEIAHRLGMHRVTVWRKRNAALDKMRNLLCP